MSKFKHYKDDIPKVRLAESIATMAIIGVVMAVLVGGGLVMRIVRAWQK